MFTFYHILCIIFSFVSYTISVHGAAFSVSTDVSLEGKLQSFEHSISTALQSGYDVKLDELTAVKTAWEKEQSRTFISIAVQHNAESVVTALLKTGTSPDEKFNKNVYLLHIAALKGPTLTGIFLEHGANPNVYRDDNKFTPLHYALKQDIATVSLLIGHNADIEARNDYGQTPLHLAALLNDIESLERLLTAGANKECVRIECKTEDENILNDFLRYNGSTPLHDVCIRRQSNKQAMIEALICSPLPAGLYNPHHGATYWHEFDDKNSTPNNL